MFNKLNPALKEALNDAKEKADKDGYFSVKGDANTLRIFDELERLGYVKQVSDRPGISSAPIKYRLESRAYTYDEDEAEYERPLMSSANILRSVPMFNKLPSNSRALLRDIIEAEDASIMLGERFKKYSPKEDGELRSMLRELTGENYINIKWADDIPYLIGINNSAYTYDELEAEYERQLSALGNDKYEQQKPDALAPSLDKAKGPHISVSDGNARINIDSSVGRSFSVIPGTRASTISFTDLDNVKEDFELSIPTVADAKSYKSDRKFSKKIFLSYSWKDEILADSIDEKFTEAGITLVRDKRDIDYRGSIKAFMKQIRHNDYVVLVISSNYLKSANCMYEITELTKDENYKTRILPVIKNNTEIFKPISRNEYIVYWQDEYKKLSKDSEKLDILNRNAANSELHRYERIMRDLPIFLESISDMNLIKCGDSIDDEDFKKMMLIVNNN